MPTNNSRDMFVHAASNLKILPSNQNTILKTLNLLKQNNVSLSEIIKIIENDMGISSKIISIANSAFFRIGMPVNTIERAVINLGVRELESILFCLYYLNIFTDFLHFKKRNLHYMLKHSIFVALSTRLLAQRTGYGEPEEAFAVSLLHDIGKIVFFMNSEIYEKLVDESQLKHEPIVEIEREIFGIDHQEIGYIIGIKWKLPDIFLSIIKNHHNGTKIDDALSYILTLVQEADRFFYFMDQVQSPESFLLNKEKEKLVEETKNILTLLSQ